MTIHKWELALDDVQDLTVPDGTQFLHVGEQNGVLTIWGLCAPESGLDDEERTLAVVGTGNWAPAEDEARYIGTVQMSSGFVWHVFEKIGVAT